MREAPTKFWKSKNLITKEGYSTNQNLGNNQLNPPYKKSILEDSYINHDILSSHSQFRRLSTSSALNFVDSQFRRLSISSTLNFINSQPRQLTISLVSSTNISESHEITWQLIGKPISLAVSPTLFEVQPSPSSKSQHVHIYLTNPRSIPKSWNGFSLRLLSHHLYYPLHHSSYQYLITSSRIRGLLILLLFLLP